ncbi:hypothetical protein EV128_108152 [Rhizobium azibense]|nr:hypothetical protein EV128_108152 [Rhizobium azibense]
MRGGGCFSRRVTGIHALAGLEMPTQRIGFRRPLLVAVLMSFSPMDFSLAEVTIDLTCTANAQTTAQSGGEAINHGQENGMLNCVRGAEELSGGQSRAAPSACFQGSQT